MTTRFPELPAPRRRNRVKEGRSYEETNHGDDSLNPGSYRATAGAGAAELAHDLLLARSPGVVPSLGMVHSLTQRLLWAMDVVQARVRTDGHVERMAGSHVRARGAVRTAVGAYPLPDTDGLSEEEAATRREEWLTNVVERAYALLRMGIDLAATDFPQATQATQAPANATSSGDALGAEGDPERSVLVSTAG